MPSSPPPSSTARCSATSSDLVVGEQYRLFGPALSNKLLDDYLDGCRERDPDMPQWNESTRRRLRSSVFQMLAQAGYIENTRSLKLQTVHIADQVLRYLKANRRRVRPALHPGGPMSDPLNERLNKILPRIISDDFLSGSGIGNEIAFYIFDYPPEDELRVRDYLRTLLDHIPKQKHGPAGQAHQPVRLRAGLPQEPQAARQGDPDAAGEGRRGAEEGPRRSAARIEAQQPSSPRSPSRSSTTSSSSPASAASGRCCGRTPC